MEKEQLINEKRYQECIKILDMKINLTPHPQAVINKFQKINSFEEIIITAKNDLLVYTIEKNGEIPRIKIRNHCNTCKGRGFFIDFFPIKEEKCPKCNGTGWKILPCKKCDGTGKLGEITCFVCKGRGTYIMKKTKNFSGKKCFACFGRGRIKKIEKENKKIKEVRRCKKCDGTGIEKVVSAPLISKETAEKLSASVSS